MKNDLNFPTKAKTEGGERENISIDSLHVLIGWMLSEKRRNSSDVVRAKSVAGNTMPRTGLLARPPPEMIYLEKF